MFARRSISSASDLMISSDSALRSSVTGINEASRRSFSAVPLRRFDAIVDLPARISSVAAAFSA